MAKISDELRAAVNMLFLSGSNGYNVLMDLADRIDAEMVEFPRDKDGVPIHVGDTVYMDDGRMAEVYSIEFKNGETNVLCRTPSGCYVSSGYVYRLPNKLTHTRPDSWERIANELEGLSVDSSDNYYVSTHCSKLADRIRKLAKEGE